MKKYFVFSDVHSFFDELKSALIEKGFDIDNPDHIVISCGDLFDRGDQSFECLEFIVKMLSENRAICIKGNHEGLMSEVFDKEYFDRHDIHNGTNKTFDQLCSNDDAWLTSSEIIKNVKDNEHLKYYLSSCKDYYELGDYIFVHGWIPCFENLNRDFSTTYVYNPKWRDSKKWFEASWVNGMRAWYDGVKEPGKTIVCGHWNTSWGHSYLHDDGKEWLSAVETFYDDPTTGKRMPYSRHDTFKDEGIMALDATTAATHMVNVEVIEM